MAQENRASMLPPGIGPGHDPAGLARLRAALRAEPRGLFTDVDGTISHIAPSPEAAVLLPGMADLLRAAVNQFEVVAAVSGRSAADAARLVGISDLLYIGNHGLEQLIAHHGDTSPSLHIVADAEPYAEAVGAVLDDIRATLAPRFPGMIVEHKGVTGTIHLRQTSDPRMAEEAVLEELARSEQARGLRVTGGKMVVEVRPPLKIDKGVTVASVIEERGLLGALYLGDDRTDIDAFRALRRLTISGVCAGASVAVLHADAPAELMGEADIVLNSIEQMPDFVRWLLQRTAAMHGDGSQG